MPGVAGVCLLFAVRALAGPQHPRLHAVCGETIQVTGSHPCDAEVMLVLQAAGDPSHRHAGRAEQPVSSSVRAALAESRRPGNLPQQNLILISRVGAPARWGERSLLGTDGGLLALCLQSAGAGSSRAPFIRHQSHSGGPHPHDPITFQRTHCQYSSWGLAFQLTNLGGHKDSDHSDVCALQTVAHSTTNPLYLHLYTVLLKPQVPRPHHI